MVDFFKLDYSQKRFFTCCDKLHVKIAFLIIIILTLIAEIMESIYYVVDGLSEMSTVLTILIEIWEYVVTFFMILAYCRESCSLMLPFVGQMIVVVVIMLILLLQLLYCIIVPYSQLAEQLFVDGRYTFLEREKKLFAILIVEALLTGLAIWFLNIGFATYSYFDFISKKKARKPAKSPFNQEFVLVRNDSIAVRATHSTESFANPNFNSNSDDDDEVFQKSSNVPSII
ncbi:hypothetical protein DICVIV_12368 [Dictyocaulus viviparus]|uniref:Uncharacterized protein n=1 Tax=Dictyocaulus viviparus TaxID=29172 RepID=A0A0D8XDC4_DICVI|nr:hypothetical protein DICVIV_12368 [Dictyocaulus viviparus]